MAVDGSHEGCFQHGSRIYVVPSDSGHTVDETAASYASASAVFPRRPHQRLHWSALVGAVLGGLFLDFSAWHSSGLTDVLDLLMMFALGGVVGFATAIGMRQALRAQPADPAVRLPAIEVPADVARRSPDDATPDELVLWSVLTRRFRAATVALENLPYENDPQDQHDSSGRAATGTLTPAATSALAEMSYVTARHDFAPVAELLGLPLPD